MEVPRGFTRCDECDGKGEVNLFISGWLHYQSCPSCSGSGLVPTEKLREEALQALADYYGFESVSDPAVVDAVLRKVAEHIREGR